MKNTFRENIRRFSVVRSLRMRLFLIIFLVGMIPCGLLHYGILNNYESRAVEVRTEEVNTQLRALANHLISYDYLSDQSSELINAELTEFSALYDGRLLVISDHLKVIKDTYSMSDGKTIVSPDVVGCLLKGTAGTSSIYDRRDGFIEIVTPIIATDQSAGSDEESEQEPSSGEVVRGVLLASVSTVTIRNTLGILSRKAMLLEMILILAVFIISLVFSWFLMKPFERLSTEIAAVRAGYSTDPINAPEFLETEHIAEAFNQVLGRMNALDASRQEFVSNVSHELKTPMTSMKVLADSLVAQDNVPVEMYREFMIDIKNEIDRENQIITELLTLVRMDRKDSKMNVAPVNVNKLVEGVLRRVRPLAQKRDIELTMVSEREVIAEIDEVKISMVVTNLVENAVKYNKDHGKVRVTVNADHREFTVRVEDTGIGIPQESLDRIYERFYRVDKSRSRDVGGTGLGLSITKSIILQHHGSIEVRSILGEGSQFTMHVPLSYVAHPAQARRRKARATAAAARTAGTAVKRTGTGTGRTEAPAGTRTTSAGSSRTVGTRAGSGKTGGMKTGTSGTRTGSGSTRTGSGSARTGRSSTGTGRSKTGTVKTGSSGTKAGSVRTGTAKPRAAQAGTSGKKRAGTGAGKAGSRPQQTSIQQK